MDSLDYYLGKWLYGAIQATGRKCSPIHFLIAAVMAANEEPMSMEQLHKALEKVNSFQPETRTQEQNLKELGF